MAKPRVLITSSRLCPGDESVQLLEEAGFEPVYNYWHGGRTEEEMLDLVGDFDAVIAATDPFTPRVLEAAGRLKVIARTGVGYDSVDVAAATARGVAVCITPGANRHAVAEFTMALILNCTRRMAENLSEVRRGGWNRYEGWDLAGSTLGIVGLGTIGKEVAQRARAFEMRILAYDPAQDAVFAESQQVSFVPLEQLLRESDVVTLHLFLSEKTRHLIDAERLSLMKPTAYLVNTSRGPVVDEEALCQALGEKRIAGAAMDVFEREPLPADSPLLRLDNVYLAPHTAGSTLNTRSASSWMAAQSVIGLFRGERPGGIVNPQVLR